MTCFSPSSACIGHFFRQRKPVIARGHPGCPKNLLKLNSKCTHSEARERLRCWRLKRGCGGSWSASEARICSPALLLEHGCALDSPTQLRKCAAGSRAYELVKEPVEEMGRSAPAVKVEMIVDLLRQCDLERRRC